MIHTITTYSFVSQIQNAGGEVYLVGGCVRDKLLGRPIKDLDVIVRFLPVPALLDILKKCGHYNLVGKAFGVIKFYPRENKALEIDISLPRTEISTGVGHRDFEIQSDPHLAVQDDLKRRDFTINAMAIDLKTGVLFDPFHGQEDLQNKLIRTVFENSFIEDPLRLLRAVQFAARFDFTLADTTLAEMKQHAELISSVSPERIILEIKKLFTAQKPSQGFALMRTTGLLPLIFHDVQNMIGVLQPKKENEDVYDHTMRVVDAMREAEQLTHAGEINLMFAALFHDAGKFKTRRDDEETGQVSFYNHHIVSAGIAGRWLKQYKATTIGVDIKKVCHLVKHHMFEVIHFEKNEKALRRFINKVGKEHIMELLDLRLADKMGGRFPKKMYGILKLRSLIENELKKKPPFTGKDLALDGHDLMSLGFKAGPVIGIIQRFLIDKVLDDPELNTREGLTKLIDDNRALLTENNDPQALIHDPQET